MSTTKAATSPIGRARARAAQKEEVEAAPADETIETAVALGEVVDYQPPVEQDRLTGARQGRPVDRRPYVAELTRGRLHIIGYGQGQDVWLRRDQKVAVSEAEFENLRGHFDRMTFGDPERGRIERSIPKFKFYDRRTGEEIHVQVPPDRVIVQHATPPEPRGFDEARRRE